MIEAILLSSATSVLPPKTVYLCDEPGCEFWVRSADNRAIVHESSVDGMTVTYIRDNLIEISYSIDGDTRTNVVDISGTALEIRNGRKIPTNT